MCCVSYSFFFFFFFSSRRRHTRCSRDWSSDVCSSDLRFLTKIRHTDSSRSRISSPVPSMRFRSALLENSEDRLERLRHQDVHLNEKLPTRDSLRVLQPLQSSRLQTFHGLFISLQR